MGNKDQDIKEGMLLVASPYMDDPFFRRSVVLVTQHDDTGTVGFLLSKPLPYQLSDLLEDFSEMGYNLSLGGPVDHSSLNFLHTLGNIVIPNAHHVSGHLFWGGNFDILTALISVGEVPKEKIRFFMGYSGWIPGQLKAELDSGAWEVTPSDTFDLVGINEDIWYDVVKTDPALHAWAFIPENFYDN